MARGNLGTFAPSQTTVHSGTYIPTANGSTSTTTTPRFSNGSHTLRRATITLAEPMRSASRSSSISSLTSPTTAAIVGSVEQRSSSGNLHNSNGTGSSIHNTNLLLEDGEITRSIRPLRGPRNPPTEMTEASMRSFAGHRTTPVMQPWSVGGGEGGESVGSNGSHNNGLSAPQPQPFQQRSAMIMASAISGSTNDSANRSGSSNHSNFSFSSSGISRYPHPQRQYHSYLRQRQRHPTEQPFRRVNSAHAVSTPPATSQWLLTSASYDGSRTADGRDPGLEAQANPMASIRLNGVEQRSPYAQEYGPHHQLVGPRYPPNAATGGGGLRVGGGVNAGLTARGRIEGRERRDRHETRFPSVDNLLPGFHASPMNARTLSQFPLPQRNDENDGDAQEQSEGGEGGEGNDSTVSEEDDSSASVDSTQSEEDPMRHPPDAPRMVRHEGFRRPPYYESGVTLEDRLQRREGMSAIGYSHYANESHPLEHQLQPQLQPPLTPQPPRSSHYGNTVLQDQQNNHHHHHHRLENAPIQYTRSPQQLPIPPRLATLDEYQSPRPSSNYRSFPRSGQSAASQTASPFTQHQYQHLQPPSQPPPQPPPSSQPQHQQPHQQNQQQQAFQQPPPSLPQHPLVHPHDTVPVQPRPAFLSQPVYQLACAACIRPLCLRAMKAVMLSDHSKELYSTDMPPSGLQLVNDDRQVRHCACRIRDSACLGCGQIIGYHVTQPCNDCLQDQNNGHFWMFYSSGVLHFRRIHKVGSTDSVMLWADVPSTAHDQCLAEQLRAAIPTLNPRRQQLQRLVIAADASTSSNQGGTHSTQPSSRGGAGAGANGEAGDGSVSVVADERPSTAWIDMEDWLKTPFGDIVCR